MLTYCNEAIENKSRILYDYAMMKKMYKKILETKFSTTRENIEKELINILENDSDIFGVWFIGFDNYFNDANNYKNKMHYGETGEFNSLYFKSENSIKGTSIESFEREEFYKKPLQSKSIEVLHLVENNVDSKPHLFTTISNVYEDNGYVVGVWGIKILLHSFKNYCIEING